MTESVRTPESSKTPSIQDYTGLASTYDQYRYVEDVHVAQESRRRRVLTGLLPRQVRRAADIACGTGRGVAVLRGVADCVVGVDGTLGMLGVAKEKLGPATRLTQANAGCLPFQDGTFDLVISLNFVHLFGTVDEKSAFVSEMSRVLKPNGVLIVEFDNAMQGIVLGAARKYFGRDIGYDWPWQIRRCFRTDLLRVSRLHGANLPFVWRWPLVRRLDTLTRFFPLNYLATRIFVEAIRR